MKPLQFAEKKKPYQSQTRTHGLSAEAAGGPTTWHWSGLISSPLEGLVSHVRVRCQTVYPSPNQLSGRSNL